MQTEGISPSTTSHTIHFLTINYHCGRLIQDLISNIRTSQDKNLAIVVVDNSPNDPELMAVANRGDVTVLQAPTNLGFGGGCNLGLSYIKSKDPSALVWLLNPDAELLPGAVETVRAAFAEIPDAAILGTRIVDFNNQIWFDGGQFDSLLGRLTHRRTKRKDQNQDRDYTYSEECDWLSGCSLAINTKELERLPEFDTQIFLDYEDAELCLRLKKEGHQPRVTKAAVIKHAVSSVTGRSPRAKYRHATFSKLYLLHKHGTAIALGLNLVYFLIRPLLLLKKDKKQAEGRWAGLCDYLAWLIRQAKGNTQVLHPLTQFTAKSLATSQKAKGQ